MPEEAWKKIRVQKKTQGKKRLDHKLGETYFQFFQHLQALFEL
jgi:hypothetical protein